MNHHTRTSGMLAALLAIPALAIGLMTPAEAAQDKKSDSVCHRATQYLPRTPDAVEGWLRHCSR